MAEIELEDSDWLRSQIFCAWILASFRSRANTASECGFTPQYAGLQALQDAYQTRGFDVLGFPCNQFGKQEPGDADEIGAFCESRFHVTFPMFEKIDVNGANAHPLYRWLTAEKPAPEPWVAEHCEPSRWEELLERFLEPVSPGFTDSEEDSS